MSAPKFRPESRIRIREDGDCGPLIPRGRPRTGRVIHFDGPQRAAGMEDPPDLPEIDFYTVTLDDGSLESIPENCLEALGK